MKSSEGSRAAVLRDGDEAPQEDSSAEAGDANGQTTARGRVAHSLSDGLLAALAAREAIYSAVSSPPAPAPPVASGSAPTFSTAAAPPQIGASTAAPNPESPVALAASGAPVPARPVTPSADESARRIAQLERERDQLAAQLAGIVSTREERDALRVEIDKMQRESQQLLTRLLDAERDCAERERRIQALEAELRELFENGLDTSTSAHPDYGNLEKRYHDLAAEHEEYRRRSVEEITRLNEELTEARRQQAELARAQAAAAQAKPDKSAELARLEAKYKQLLNEAEKDRRRHAQEIASMSEHLSQARNREQKLLAEIEKLRSSGATVMTVAEEQPEPLQQRPIVGASAPSMALAPGAAPPIAKPTLVRPAAGNGPVSSAEMILLDPTEVGQEVLQRVARFNLAIEQPPAAADLVSYCSGPGTICLLANLALPIAWTLVRRLRTNEKTRHLQVIGYALPPRADLGFWFGRFDINFYPSGSNELLDMIRRIGTSGSKQAIGIGASEQVLQDISRSLARDRVRVTTALDRRQALDAVRSVFPELAILYPAPNPVDAFRALAGIREIPAFKDLPLVLVLDDVAREREEEKLSGGVRTILRLGNLVPEELTQLVPTSLTLLKGYLRGARR